MSGITTPWIPVPVRLLSKYIDGRLLNGRYNLSFSCQNCNSMNLSCADPVRDKKVASILQLDSDIIMLCDIRVTNKNKIFSDLFRLRYRSYTHSTVLCQSEE
jgi:hypothetical protein